MVFLPGRTSLTDVTLESDDTSHQHGARLIIDLLDVVGSIRDGEHLQCVAFLAQEFELVARPHYLFGTLDSEPRRPHSLLLEGRFYALLRDGVVDVDGAGRLRLRRDLFAVPTSGRAGRRLSALNTLSSREAAIFAAAVMHLAGQGRHAGSNRHDEAFRATVSRLAVADTDQPVDVETICATRHRLLPSEPVLLSHA